MSILDYILIIIVASVIVGAVKLNRHRSRHSNCCGHSSCSDCSSCSGCSSQNK